MDAQPATPLPDRPPFRLRARIITPVTNASPRGSAAGGTPATAGTGRSPSTGAAAPVVVHPGEPGGGPFLDLPDGLLAVDAAGRIGWLGPAAARPDLAAGAIRLDDTVLLPGLIDLHAHLPQVPKAGLGAGLDLLTWLERDIFPLERGFDAAAAARLVPLVLRSFAAVGTTTIVAYSAVYADSTDVAFQAAEAHGIRAVIGLVLMDRRRYDHTAAGVDVVERDLRDSAELCARWHGRDEGRLRYAVTPRFAVSCSAPLLAGAARLAAETGAYWQTHLAEDRGELAEVARLFPEARDYLDVYDRAGGLTPRAILAHAIHLGDREVARLADSGASVAHCPTSNLFLASGVMPLARYLEAGIPVGLGSDVAGGPEQSLFAVMRVGAYVQTARRVVRGDPRPVLDPLGWLRLTTLGAARCLGLDSTIGSLETGKEADLIAVDVARSAPAGGSAMPDSPQDVISRLMFRAHPDMVTGAWVRGRRLAT